jgi:hypothetical protein
MFGTLVEKGKTTKLGPKDTIKKFLKHRCLRSLCIVHLDLIYMSYDKKKGRESNQIGNLTPDHKSLKSMHQMRSDWGVLYTVGNNFLRAIRYFPHIIYIYIKDLI